MTPEELVRKIFAEMNAANWLADRVPNDPVFAEYSEARILFREVIADVSGITLEPFWVTSSVVAEPRVRAFEADFREWTAIRLVMHMPAVFTQHGTGYRILTNMDQEVMQRLRASKRLANSTFVSDFPGEPVGSMERDRTVLIR